MKIKGVESISGGFFVKFQIHSLAVMKTVSATSWIALTKKRLSKMLTKINSKLTNFVCGVGSSQWIKSNKIDWLRSNRTIVFVKGTVTAIFSEESAASFRMEIILLLCRAKRGEGGVVGKGLIGTWSRGSLSI